MEKVTKILLTVRLTKRHSINERILFKPKLLGENMKEFCQKTDLANLKSDLVKLDIDEMKNLPSNLSNLKSKVGKLNVDKLVPVPADLSKLSDVVKNDFS